MSINGKTDEVSQIAAYHYAVQCFIDDFGKNIPNLLDIGVSTTLSEEHSGCKERRSDWWFRNHELGAVRMDDVQGGDGFTIEGISLEEYDTEEREGFFDYILDSLKRNEFKNTLLSLLKRADSEAIEDPDDGVWYNPHELRN